jgi:hypothetical protein
LAKRTRYEVPHYAVFFAYIQKTMKVTIVVIEKPYLRNFGNILLSRLTPYAKDLNEDRM